MKSNNFFTDYKTCKFIVKTVKNTQETHFQKTIVPVSINTIKEKSKCAICLIERTFICEIEDKYNLKSKIKNYPKSFTDQCYKRKWRLIV